MKLRVPQKVGLQGVLYVMVHPENMDDEMENRGIGVWFVESVLYVKKVLSDLVNSINFKSLSWVE